MLDFGFITLLLEFCAKLRKPTGALSDCRRTQELDGLCQNEGKELKKKIDKIKSKYASSSTKCSNTQTQNRNLHPLTFAHFLPVALRSHIRTCTSGSALCVFLVCSKKKRAIR